MYTNYHPVLILVLLSGFIIYNAYNNEVICLTTAIVMAFLLYFSIKLSIWIKRRMIIYYILNEVEPTEDNIVTFKMIEKATFLIEYAIRYYCVNYRNNKECENQQIARIALSHALYLTDEAIRKSYKKSFIRSNNVDHNFFYKFYHSFKSKEEIMKKYKVCEDFLTHQIVIDKHRS